MHDESLDLLVIHDVIVVFGGALAEFFFLGGAPFIDTFEVRGLEHDEAVDETE